MKIIELFAGVGTQFQVCKDLDSTTECAGISEIDERALKGYNALHGKPHNFGDITKIESLPEADIWFYSFPCTDISIAGKQQGFEGEHSSLLYEVYRLLLSSSKPQYLIMENVANLVSAKFLPQFQEWIDMLTAAGYKSVWKKVRACDYGGATIRNRVFMVSTLSQKEYVFPKVFLSNTTIKDFLEPIELQNLVEQCVLQDVETFNYKNSTKLCDYKNGGQGNRIYSTLGQGVSLTSCGGGHAGSGGGLYYREGGIYRLSPREMCKVMGWNNEETDSLCSVLTPREIGFVMGNAIDRICLREIMKPIFA